MITLNFRICTHPEWRACMTELVAEVRQAFVDEVVDINFTSASLTGRIIHSQNCLKNYPPKTTRQEYEEEDIKSPRDRPQGLFGSLRPND